MSRSTVATSARRIVLSALVAATAVACSNDGRELRPPRADQNESIITTTSAPDNGASFDVASLPALEPDVFEISVPWSNDETIPDRYTCNGENVSPEVAWFDVTPAAVAMAIIFYEEGPQRIVHWSVANLDPATAYIEAGTTPADALVGANDPILGEPAIGYRGPCPAAGESRSYTIEVHALGQFLDLPPGTPADDLMTAIDLASVQMSSVTGTAVG